MKNLQAYFFAFMLMITMTLSGCDVIGDIFQAGMWTAVIIIVIVIALVMWLLRKIRR
jgi:Ni,Fe-hydrogenase I cytochrome b subunit